MGNRWGNSGKSVRLYFWGLQNHCRWWLQPWNLKMLTPWKESYHQPRQHIKKQRHYFANKGPSGQGYGFSTGHVWMWELDCEEGWVLKNWCFWTVVLEKTHESPLGCKEIQPVHPKGDQSWVFIGRTDAEAETPILWPPDAKSGLIWKDPDAGRDWGQEEKGTTKDEMAGWHYQLDGHELSKLWELVMDREAWHAVSHGVRKRWTRLSDWTRTGLMKFVFVLQSLCSINMVCVSLEGKSRTFYAVTLFLKCNNNLPTTKKAFLTCNCDNLEFSPKVWN